MAERKTAKALYELDGTLRQLSTSIVSISKADEVPEHDRALFKDLTPADYVLQTAQTIFYAQGGGQPFDLGRINAKAGEPHNLAIFDVTAVRTSSDGKILHRGIFASPSSKLFQAGDPVEQEIDGERRDLNSRLHTAGHVLGLAVRQLSDVIPDVVELKASHYPDAAFVEFRGLIDGQHKPAIQKATNDLVARGLPVQVHWWDECTLRQKCTAVPDAVTVSDGPTRAVEIGGAGAYPCGGTHVANTSLIGSIEVRRISRQKGITKISYSVK